MRDRVEIDTNEYEARQAAYEADYEAALPMAVERANEDPDRAMDFLSTLSESVDYSQELALFDAFRSGRSDEFYRLVKKTMAVWVERKMDDIADYHAGEIIREQKMWGKEL